MSVHHPAANSLLRSTPVQCAHQIIRLKTTSIYLVVIRFARIAGQRISKHKSIRVQIEALHSCSFRDFQIQFFVVIARDLNCNRMHGIKM